MAGAVAKIFSNRLSGGIVIVKEGHAADQTLEGTELELMEASHPVPDERGVKGTENILALLEEAREDDLVICLISGGGSALLTAPVAGISLSDLQDLTKALLACGATINEMNALRKHLDRVKGGGLARAASPAHVFSLILSDVVGNPLDVIASGPTVPDTTTFQDAYAILEHYDLLEKISPDITEHIRKGVRGKANETPKPGDPIFERVQNFIIGSNLTSVEAAISQAQNEGFNTLLLTTYLQGEARQAGRVLAAIARQIAVTGQPIPRPACIVAGGETTVTLRGDGLGGRNQELALGAVEELAGLKNAALVTLATDGDDGPTDAAGAVVTGDTLKYAERAGLYPNDFLERNDSYHFFEPLGDLLKPGPTQTNVNDLVFIFVL